MIVFILLVIIIYKILDFERRVEDLEHKIGNLSHNYDRLTQPLSGLGIFDD